MCRSKSHGGRRCTGHHPTHTRTADLAAIAATSGSTTERLYGGQSAITDLVTTPDGRRAVRKSAPTWDDPDDARFKLDGEYLASAVADAIGAPIARVHTDSPDADTVWVEYVEGTPDGVNDLLNTPDAIRVGLLDAVTGYRDRSGGLLATDDGHLRGFDNGGSWLPAALGTAPGTPPAPEKGAPMTHFVTDTGWAENPPVDAAELAGIRDRMEGLRPEFAAAGRTGWLDHSLAALDQISQHAHTETPTTATPVTAGAAEKAKAKRAERRAAKVQAWEAADRGMRDATIAVEGREYGTTVSNILLGAIARRDQHAENGGDPTVYDDQIAEFRTLVTNVLTERGDSPDTAAQKIARLESAHRTYASTPEVNR